MEMASVLGWLLNVMTRKQCRLELWLDQDDAKWKQQLPHLPDAWKLALPKSIFPNHWVVVEYEDGAPMAFLFGETNQEDLWIHGAELYDGKCMSLSVVIRAFPQTRNVHVAREKGMDPKQNSSWFSAEVRTLGLNHVSIQAKFVTWSRQPLSLKTWTRDNRHLWFPEFHRLCEDWYDLRPDGYQPLGFDDVKDERVPLLEESNRDVLDLLYLNHDELEKATLVVASRLEVHLAGGQTWRFRRQDGKSEGWDHLQLFVVPVYKAGQLFRPELVTGQQAVWEVFTGPRVCVLAYGSYSVGKDWIAIDGLVWDGQGMRNVVEDAYHVLFSAVFDAYDKLQVREGPYDQEAMAVAPKHRYKLVSSSSRKGYMEFVKFLFT